MPGSQKIISIANNQLTLCLENGSYRLPLASEVEIKDNESMFVFDNFRVVPFQYINLVSGTLFSTAQLRASWGLIPHADYEAAVKGAELLNWDNEQRFCSRCGASLQRVGEICKKCPSCNFEVFPSLSPAIVVLVKKDDKALLVHGNSLRGNIHALVAGFVETGETLEQCVARELMEETSLEVEDIRYFGSQSWPFPHQLMIGFTAKYKSGEICFADGELSAGNFFSRDYVPDLPSLPSLSRQIIDAWIAGE